MTVSPATRERRAATEIYAAERGFSTFDSLSQQQQTFVALRVRGGELSEHSRRVGVSRQTGYNWEHADWFAPACDEERERFLNGGRLEFFRPLVYKSYRKLEKLLDSDNERVVADVATYLIDQAWGKSLQHTTNQTNIDVTIDALDSFVNILRNTRIIDADVKDATKGQTEP